MIFLFVFGQTISERLMAYNATRQSITAFGAHLLLVWHARCRAEET